jgi:hypothetical protein
MMQHVAVAGDRETGMRGILQEHDTPETAAVALTPFCQAGNLEAIYMYVVIVSWCQCLCVCVCVGSTRLTRVSYSYSVQAGYYQELLSPRRTGRYCLAQTSIARRIRPGHLRARSRTTR